MLSKQKITAYAQLTRFDRPVGIELLLYPTLWAVFLAGYNTTQGMPNLATVLIFSLGAVFMRAAGCAINDFADRDFDGHVERTKNRPLASGVISAKEALAVFAVLVLASASLLLFLPIDVFYWSFGALFLATLYPFCKRFTYLPQFVLGMAFSWAIPMAYVAVQGAPDVWCWLLYIANLCWTVAYDTQYAITDREDDLQAGIKSTAILFGNYDIAIISLLQGTFLAIMAVVLVHYFGLVGLLALIAPIMLFIKQYQNTKDKNPQACFNAFLNNVYVGWAVLVGIITLTICS